ncbi:hypothetical protein KGM_210611 [Danaus plexippus plexippus]|uniref:Immunoglobulin V-set domain-containing protein n=1 Tax=Danaus plexippus plexippus TaxID=278856 RepID=A0A212FAQ1_DANPL|nr:hypothetical protein KGM_210611 [Danaus plexippus plexippus]
MDLALYLRSYCFQVSWIRHRDLHILTVGGYTYTSDQRFQASHSPQTDDWTLQVKWAQQRDAGVYECQVSTQPVRSFFVTLHVVEPKACSVSKREKAAREHGTVIIRRQEDDTGRSRHDLT